MTIDNRHDSKAETRRKLNKLAVIFFVIGSSMLSYFSYQGRLRTKHEEKCLSVEISKNLDVLDKAHEQCVKRYKKRKKECIELYEKAKLEQVKEANVTCSRASSKEFPESMFGVLLCLFLLFVSVVRFIYIGSVWVWKKL